MSVENLPNISSVAVDKLTALVSSVEFDDKKRRLGVNGVDKMSVYRKSRWYEWTREQKSIFEAAFNQAYIEKSVVGWFLHFPANTGFLDQMNAWQNATHAGNIIAFSLSDNNSIWIDGTEYHAAKGEGYKFSLKHLHEVKTSPDNRYWACLMLMEN